MRVSAMQPQCASDSSTLTPLLKLHEDGWLTALPLKVYEFEAKVYEFEALCEYIASNLYSAGARSALMRMRTQCQFEGQSTSVLEAFTICDRKAIISLLRDGADVLCSRVYVRTRIYVYVYIGPA